MTEIGVSEVGLSGGGLVEEVSADEANLSFFVDNGATYASNLSEILFDLRRAISEIRSFGIDFVPPRIGGRSAVGSMEQLIGIADDNSRFVAELVDSLLDRAAVWSLPMTSDLRGAVLRGSLPFPDEAIRDRVVAAMSWGLTPSEADLAPEYFPLTYRSLLAADDRLEELAVQREEADGSSWSWFDGDSERMANIDRQAGLVQQRRERLAETLGADSDARLSDVEAIASVGQWTGAQAWEGLRYATWLGSYVTENSRRFDNGKLQLLRVDDGAGTGADFELIGQRLAGRPEGAVEFFNGVGVSTVAALPTFLIDNYPASDDTDHLEVVLSDFGNALAAATELEDGDGRPRLAFTGDELINVDPPSTQHNLLWHHPALLLSSGRFEPQFLADATTASLINAQSGDPRATEMIIGRVQSLGNTWWNESGEDPRNVLLARAAEDPIAAAIIVDQISYGSVGLRPLLSPEVPFEPTETRHPPDDYHPTLGSEYPITSLLIAAGLDDVAANTILNAAAGDRDRGFSDTGVAAGIDGLQAMHATLMYPHGSLAPVGITRSGVNSGSQAAGAREVTAAEWRRTLRKVMDYGHGQQLGAATDALLGEAIAGSITSEGFDADPVGPFALIAGATGSEVAEARFAYAAGLDDDARRSNRIAGTVASGMFALLGLAAGPAGPAVSAAVGGAGVGYTAFGPEGLPTDNELAAYRDEYEQLLYADQDRSTGWANLIYDQMLEHAAQTGHLELTVPGATEPQLVNLTTKDSAHQWQHPTTGQWHDLPIVFSPEFNDMFEGTSLDAGVKLDSHLATQFMNGVIWAADDTASVAARRDNSGTDHVGSNDRTSIRVEDAIRTSNETIGRWIADG